jgi:hypothetical protein
MAKCGWKRVEIEELGLFFFRLDRHQIRQDAKGLQTILCYQERVRRNWTAALKRNEGYAISTINDNLLYTYQRQIITEEQERNNVSTPNQNLF